ncbi:MAG: glycosyltransferase family 4 protein, partial [Acidobacteria bacterium]|nr:glycosyltransferase family 4 protein [Acidobacteriota bacterium]
AAAKIHREVFRNEIGIGERDLIDSFVGRLTEIKNVSMYLKAAAEYEKTSGSEEPKVHFVIVGDGHLRPALEKEASDLGVKNIHFPGNRQDVEVIYAGTDIVALTSLNEGTPLSLIEAMAGGRPVISTTVGGVVDLLGPVVETVGDVAVHERGVGISSGDVNAFVTGLIYLVKNEKLRDELAARGQAFVFSNYNKDRMVDDLRTVYRELLGEDK